MKTKNKTFFKVVSATALLGGAVAFWTGCNKSSGGGDSTASSGVTITGKLATGTVTSSSVTQHPVYVNSKGEALKQSLGKIDVAEASTDIHELAISDYKVRCVTLSGTLKSGEGTCDTAGAFSLSLLADAGSPVGCFVMKNDTLVATVAFEGSSTGMSGSSQREGSYVAGSSSGGFDFGTMTIDVDKGLAIVKKSAITTSNGATGGAAAGSFADMTGSWTIHAISNPPTGYVTAVTSGNDGPTDGQTIYMAQYSAKDTSAATHFGLAIWESQSVFTSCTSGGGEGAQLPAGWTLLSGAGSSTLTGALALTTTFPDPSNASVKISNASKGGQTLCGITLSNSNHTCSEFGNTYTWLAGANSSHWGMTPAECQFYCAMNNMWDYSSTCTAEFNVDWGSLWGSNGQTSPFSGITWGGSSWSGLTSSSSTDAVTYFSGAVKFRKQPRKRFMFNELVVSGGVGTLIDHKDRVASACTSYQAGGGCASANLVQCHISENNRLTITQTSSTSANVELIQVTKVSDTDSSYCAADENIKKELKSKKYIFTVSK